MRRLIVSLAAAVTMAAGALMTPAAEAAPIGSQVSIVGARDHAAPIDQVRYRRGYVPPRRHVTARRTAVRYVTARRYAAPRYYAAPRRHVMRRVYAPGRAYYRHIVRPRVVYGRRPRPAYYYAAPRYYEPAPVYYDETPYVAPQVYAPQVYAPRVYSAPYSTPYATTVVPGVGFGGWGGHRGWRHR